MADKRKFALFISQRSVEAERDMNAGHMRMGVVEVVGDPREGKIRNPDPGHLFNDLVFRCQWTGRMDDGKPYAFELQYEAGDVDLNDAERIVRGLRRGRQIEKRFIVRPNTFGQWCTLMAKGLGISGVVKWVSGPGFSYEDNEYRAFPLGDMQDVIDRAILDCQQEREVVA